MHLCEGGEGKVTAQYIVSRIELAKHHLRAQDYEAAIGELHAALVYPLNLGEAYTA